VRAQAAEWAVDHPAPEVVEALLDLLDDAAGTVRFAAHASLLRMGDVVIEPLTRLLARPDGDRVEAALGVAAGLADPRLLPPILAACRSRLPRARALAATALGITGGHDGVAALTALLDDPAPTVRAAAAQALGRLGFWPAAQRLAPLLRDAAWSVRREAGLALRAFGAPGVLYLRRLLSDHDPFAVDMARHVLDLPDVIMHPGAPSP
jgi:HEAT repeat protein